jgi:hypothetical protein
VFNQLAARPEQERETSQSDDGEGEIGNHVIEIRNAEKGAFVGEDVIPLRLRHRWEEQSDRGNNGGSENHQPYGGFDETNSFSLAGTMRKRPDSSKLLHIRMATIMRLPPKTPIPRRFGRFRSPSCNCSHHGVPMRKMPQLRALLKPRTIGFNDSRTSSLEPATTR